MIVELPAMTIKVLRSASKEKTSVGQKFQMEDHYRNVLIDN